MANKIFVGSLILMLGAVGVCCALAKASIPPTVWTVSGMDRVARDQAPGEKRDVMLFAAKGEFEPFQIAVRAPKGGLTNVDVKVSDLTGPGGAVIAKSNLALYREHYIQVKHATTDRPEATVKSLGPGWYADALIPFIDPSTGKAPLPAALKAAGANVAEGLNQPYWVDVFVPRNAKPGRYSGTYTVTSDQGKVTGNIALEVWNFTLPVKPSEPSMFLLWTDQSKETMREVVRHKMGPVSPKADQLAELSKMGMSVVSTGFFSGADVGNKTMGEAPSVEKIKAKISGWPAELRKINYTADEISNAPELDDTFRVWGKNLHEAGVQQLLVGSPNPALFDDGTGHPVIDIYVIMPCNYDRSPANVSDAMKRGIEIWSYTTANQDDYGPKWQIDFAPINYRAMQGFINQSMGFKGVLYWALDRWQTKDVYNGVDDFFDGSYYPGNTTVAYPGKDVGVKGIVASMRMKWIRKGIEDYDYIELLKKAGKTDQALAISRGVAKDWRHWSQDPDTYEEARHHIASILSKGN